MGIRPQGCSKLAESSENNNDIIIFWHDFNITSFDVVLFLFLILVTDPSFMLISSVVLELWQFSFLRDWMEIRKLEIPPSKFCTISGDLGELWIPNLARIFLIKCYWMLQNFRVTAFWVIKEKQTVRWGGITPKIRVNWQSYIYSILVIQLAFLPENQSKRKWICFYF